MKFKCVEVRFLFCLDWERVRSLAYSQSRTVIPNLEKHQPFLEIAALTKTQRGGSIQTKTTPFPLSYLFSGSFKTLTGNCKMTCDLLLHNPESW